MHTNDPRERAFVAGLRRLAQVRGDSRPPSALTPEPWRTPLEVLAVLALVQVVFAVVLTAFAIAAGSLTRPGIELQLAMGLPFALSCVLLGPAALRDSRALLLLTIFALVASAFAHPVVATADGRDAALIVPFYRGLYPDVFAAAVLWQFAAVFPRVSHVTWIDRLASPGSVVAWVVASVLCVVNLVLAYHPDADALHTLGRNDSNYLYWRLFAAVALPAIVLVVVRAGRADMRERRKVLRLATAFSLGAGPFVVVGVSRFLPAMDAWTRAPGVRTWLDPVILLPLALLPVLTSLAVLVDAPFAALRAIRKGQHDGGSWRWSWSVVKLGLLPRRLRSRLPLTLDDIRRTRGARELIVALERELQSALELTHVEVLEPSALPPGTALIPLLGEAAEPLDLAASREPFVLLPRRDREWLEARQARLAAAIRLPDGTVAAVILFGRTRSGRDLDRTDRWFVRTLLLGAAGAWPARADVRQGDEPAFECGHCGRLYADPATRCGGTEPTVSALPLRLAGKYRVARRLGSGGMGVVYLGRDEVLGRDVALKTLPGLQDGAVPRLRGEARVMAALNHPAIATIYALEVWRATPVLALEYFPHGTLADRLAAGPVAFAELVQLGIRLINALDHVHRRGLLHRDVKPSNIGYTADGDAKLLDFGIAGIADERAGTRGYLSPEAIAGAPPDVSFDLWALAEVLRVASGHDPRFDPFLARALAPTPGDRYPSAVAMQHALGRLADGPATNSPVFRPNPPTADRRRTD